MGKESLAALGEGGGKVVDKEEEWRDVVVEDWDFGGAYQVSDRGRVRSRKSGDWRALKGSSNPGSYVICPLYLDGKKKYILGHRLVAQAFIPNPDNYPVVMHLDDDKVNNHVENLRWGTQKDNIRDMYSKGRGGDKGLKGEKNPLSKLTEANVREIRRLLAEGEKNQTEIGEMSGVSKALISQIKTGKRWKHLM